MNFFSGLWNWFTGNSITSSLAKVAMVGYASKLLSSNTNPSVTNTTEPDKGVRLQLSPSTDNAIPILYGSAYFGGTYYDNSNTAYYVKPSSTSNFASAIFNNQIIFSPNNGNTINGGYSNAGDGADIWMNYRGYQDGFSYYRNFNVGNGKGSNIMWCQGSSGYTSFNNGQSASYTVHVNGTGYASGDFRAPTFYDSNNTGYYVKPSGTSILYQITGAVTYGSYGSISVTGSLNGYSGISFPSVSATLMMNQGASGFYFNNSTWGGYFNSSGNLYTGTYYDISNTGYYVRPSSTSNFYLLQKQNACNVPGIFIQSGTSNGTPSATTGGDFWWNTDTGTLNIWWPSASAWVAATPVPDTSVFFRTSGGNITGSVGIGGSLTVTGSTTLLAGLVSNGSIYASGNITAYSDVRKKTNIQTVDNAINKVKDLRGVYYERIDDGIKSNKITKKDIGVIAQEVLNVLPEVVSYSEGLDEYSVAYGNIVGLLIEAIKEQQKQIDELKRIVKESK